MDPRELAAAPVVPRERGALRAAFRYVRATPALRVPLLMMALVGTLSFNFIVLLPLLARFSFDGGPSGYAWLVATMGVGSVVGALVAGTRRGVSERMLTVSSAAFGALILLLAVAPSIELAAAVLVPLGAASVTFAAGVNSKLQLAVRPEMRGRVMALYSMVFLGSTPIGGPLSGWLAETWSPRLALLVGGVAALVAAIGARAAFARAAPATADIDPCEDARPRRAPPGSSRPSRPARSSHSGSSPGTAGGSPRRSRTGPPARSRS
jgi:MFS family permease